MTRQFQHRSLRTLAAALAVGATFGLAGACNDDGGDDGGGGPQQEQNQQPDQEQDED